MNKKLLNQIRVVVIIMFAACTVWAADEGQLIAVLKSNAGAVEKCDACRQLRVVGTAQSVPALASLLRDERVGHAARYALEGMPCDEAGIALRESVGKTLGLVKVGLIDSVGWRGDTAAVEMLAPLLSVRDATIASAAATALGRIGSRDAEVALVAACDESEGQVLVAVAEALLQCAERRLNFGDGAGAAGRYRKVMAVAPSPAMRAAAWRGLALADSERRGAFVVERLCGDDETLRLAATRLVREIEDKQLVRTCMQNWKELPVDAQVLLIDVISAQGERAWLPDIVKACSSQEEAVRVAAIKGVGVLGNAAHVAFLAERATQTSRIEQVAATEGLRKLKGPNVNTTLAAEIRHADNAGKVIICRALVERNAVEASSALIEAAKTGGGSTRAEALKALRDLAGKREIPALVELILVVEPSETDEVGKVLSSVARRHSAGRQCTETILSKYKNARNDAQRSTLLMTLGGMGDERALPVFRAALDGTNKQVCDAAVRGLSQWPDAAPNGDPMDDLLNIAGTSKIKAHRVLALRGYVNLITTAENLSPAQKAQACKKAVELAEGPGEKTRALAKTAELNSIEALEVAGAYLGDSSLKNEAAVAAVGIAQKAFNQDLPRAKAVLKKVLEADVPQSVKQKASAILLDIDSVKDYLVRWQVAGPYVQEGKGFAELFDIPFGPEIPNAEVKWKQMPVTKLGNHPAYLDLLKELNGGDLRVAYLRTAIQSDSDEAVTFEMYSDDSVKAWLNGKLIHALNVPRAIPANPDIVNATLKEGDNELMLKITQNNMPWGAIVLLKRPAP